ncbi:CAP domain-containing protein [Xylariaceae sp. FL0255]|nr:CAP domain-containing protein [Xylariaceae sp. FL0255]
MVKNSTLEAQAQGYMNTGCPNGDPTSGSNWFATTGTGSFAAALGAWYSERSNYTANSDDFLCNSFDNSGTTSSGSTVSMQETGHFTQMVWNASTSVGCALSSTCSGSWTTQVLCLYYPVGK